MQDADYITTVEEGGLLVRAIPFLSWCFLLVVFLAGVFLIMLVFAAWLGIWGFRSPQGAPVELNEKDEETPATNDSTDTGET